MSDPHEILVARALDLGLDVRGQSTAELRTMIADPMTDQEKQIEAAVWLHFLSTGEPATAKVLATATQQPLAWVRHHWPAGRDVEAVNVSLRGRRVDALQPTRAYLRERVMELMAAAQGQS